MSLRLVSDADVPQAGGLASGVPDSAGDLEGLRAGIEETVRTAYRALWLRDYARFDIRLDDQDNVWVLEANANPYLSRGHEFSEAAKKAGIPYPDLVDRIVKDAHARYRND